MTNKEFVEKLKKVVAMKTLYVKGGFGLPLNAKNKDRVINAYAYNKNREPLIRKQSDDTFAFDCAGVIKSVIGGFTGDKNKVYGGDVVTKKNGMLYHGVCPDYNEKGLLNVSRETLSTDFSTIEIGEFLYCAGHCGIYIGDGLAIECTPSWSDGVQITGVRNLNKDCNGKTRTWLSHSKLPYITYEKQTAQTVTTPTRKTNLEIAKEVIKGKWGNGTARRNALEKAGYNYKEVQAIVNRLLKG